METNLKLHLKQLLIDRLKFEDMTPEDIDPEARSRTV